MVSGQIGVTGFYDFGRVWVETFRRWHHGRGAGLFFTTPGRHNLISLLVATSESNTACYLRGGLVF